MPRAMSNTSTPEPGSNGGAPRTAVNSEAVKTLSQLQKSYSLEKNRRVGPRGQVGDLGRKLLGGSAYSGL